MTDKMHATYVERARPLLEDAQKAYGARNINSPQHEASRELTKILVEFHSRQGSLLRLSKDLDVAYAGLRRRVRDSGLAPLNRKTRQKFTEDEYRAAVAFIDNEKNGTVEGYHDAVLSIYERGMSLTRIAREMGLSSANPLYFGVNRARTRRLQDSKVGPTSV